MEHSKILDLLTHTFSLPVNPSKHDGKTLIPNVDGFENTDYKNGSLKSVNDDTNIFLTYPETFKYTMITFNIAAEIPDTPVQIFFKIDENAPYKSENSFVLGKADGQYKIRLIEFPSDVKCIRLDAVGIECCFDLIYFEIKKVSEFNFSFLKPLKLLAKLFFNDKKNLMTFLQNAKASSLKNAMIKHANINEFTNKSTYAYRQPELTDSIKKQMQSFKKTPLVSIVMPVFNVDPIYLNEAIKSIKKQWYDKWEICIADDASTNRKTIKCLKKLSKHHKIKIVFLKKNLNISGASNEALNLAKGEYIALMDNDDELTPDALFEVVKAINDHDAEFIYSDEDKLEMNGDFSDPHFKPDFAPELFFSQNYLSHLGVIKHALVKQVEGWTIGLEGAQDYDLYLKVLELTNKIVHIPKVLYHWRKIPGSTAADFGEKSYANEAGRKALENALKRRKIHASVKNGRTAGTYKVDYKIIGNPLVSIIIPFKDKPELIRMCINSIIQKSTYENFEIIGLSNNSSEKKTFQEMKSLSNLDERIHFHEYNIPFNYSTINNYAAKKYASGKFVIFLNNDIEIITPEWIEEMLMYAQLKNVGFVGAKLYFPNDTIQHAGLVTAPYTDHAVISVYQSNPRNYLGYFSRASCVNNFSSLTAACIMTEKKLFFKLGGFDEKNQKIAYNDVDICLRATEHGFRNVLTPYCEAYHYESLSRGYEKQVKEIERREKEKFYLKQKHPKFFKIGDPFFNPNLSLISINYDIHQKNRTDFHKVTPMRFSHNIIKDITFSDKKNHNLCIFSHFSNKNTIERYVIHYLKELAKYSDIIFVSTAEGLIDEELHKISSYSMRAIVKKNYGYDFGAWKTGLTAIGNKINSYNGLILCNDSVFGPITSFKKYFDKISKENFDVYGMTDNQQISYHIQSFFIYYSHKAFNHPVFKDFFDDFKIYEDKQTLIENNEIKFSERLQKTNLKINVFCSSAEFDSFLNITHFYWSKLLTQKSYPFIKKELIRDNPMRVDISDWRELISNLGYDATMIDEALS